MKRSPYIETAERADAGTLQATREVASAITHELRSILGSARTAARAEVDPFEDSKTAHALGRMDRFLQALDDIAKASAPAVQEEFDLSRLVQDALSDLGEDAAAGVGIRQAGPTSLLVLGDPRRIEVAFVNGLRNGIEAVLELAVQDERAPILVTWGATDEEAWIAIADRGTGLASGYDQAFDIGQTTKPKTGHQGMGLAIARRSLRSIDGDVSLSPRDGGGSIFEIRWPSGRPR